MTNGRIASLSLDLDNKWSYLKTHGDPGWETFPSYLDVVIPRVLDFLDSRGLKITFFVVGQDAALEKNRHALASITKAGHEIGNHAFHHEPWLGSKSEEEVSEELAAAEEAIMHATGQKPVGFRGPGFCLSEAILRVLIDRGYSFDASTFPTFLGPLARLYYFLTARMTPEERNRRRQLFGTFRDGLRPVKPYRWHLSSGDIVEIPVTTMPFLKTPMHFSYLLYLSGFSRALALQYCRTTLRMCLLAGVAPSLLLHPLDFLGREDESDLSFFPAMRLPRAHKLAVLSETLEIVGTHFSIRTMGGYCAEIRRQGLRSIDPVFASHHD